ncbi:MAG TPA: hypothetical protein PKX92_03515 [Edaphocola sp.]|nr:hypothetical protein [Edaphocola sp.]
MGKYIIRTLIIFLVLIGLAYLLNFSTQGGYDMKALWIGDTVLALLSIMAYAMAEKSIKNDNPNVFIRAKMASTLIRLMVCVIGILVFVYLNNKSAGTKPTIFLLLGMYVVYTILESAVLSKMGRMGKTQ